MGRTPPSLSNHPKPLNAGFPPPFPSFQAAEAAEGENLQLIPSQNAPKFEEMERLPFEMQLRGIKLFIYVTQS